MSFTDQAVPARAGQDSTPRTEGAAIVVAALAFTLGALVALPLFWGQSAPIAGPSSVAQVGALAAGIVGTLGYLAGSIRRDDRPARLRGVDLVDTVVIALAHGITALLGCLVLGAVMAASFQDAVVYFLAAVILAGLVAGVSAYVAFLSASGMTLIRLSLVMAAFAVAGLIAAMLSAPDPHWWQLHLSALGMTDSVSSLTFNVTLILAGAMMTAVARSATDLRGIHAETRRAAIRVRIGLITMGVLLALVGLFPLDRVAAIHNASAVGLLVTFSLIVFWVRPALPDAPRAFIVLGYGLFAALVLLAVFFLVGYYVLTATELAAAGIIFGWLIVYLRVSGSAVRTDAPAGKGPATVGEASTAAHP